MLRPHSPAMLLAFITATLTPAVETLVSGAEQSHEKAEADASQAVSDKAAAEAAVERAHQELVQAEAERNEAAIKANGAAKVKDELETVQGLLVYVDKLPDPKDQEGLFEIINKQLDKLMGDLGMGFDEAGEAVATESAVGA